MIRAALGFAAACVPIALAQWLVQTTATQTVALCVGAAVSLLVREMIDP